MTTKHHLLAALIAAAPIVAACNGDDIPDAPDIDISGPTIDNKTPLSPEDQKEYLEAVAEAFMDLTPASDFQEYADLINYCDEEFEDYEWDEVEDWAQDAWDALIVKTGQTVEEGSWYDYIYQNYDALVAASNFTGHFEDRGGYWKYTQANDLQFSFKDDRGNNIVAILTTKGGSKKVNISEIEGDSDWEDDAVYYKRFNTTVVVPEQIDVVVKKGSTTLVHTTVSIDISALSANNFVNTSNLSISQTTELNNGYRVQLSQVKYTGGKTAGCTFALSNKSGNLLTAAVGADIKNLPNFNSGNFDPDDYDEDDLDYIDGSVTQVSVDVLGKVQVKGSLADVRKFIDYIDAADDCSSTDKEGITSNLNKANRLLNLGLYYNGKSIRQASVTVEAVVDEEWNGRTYYDIMPVLNFEDGSSYDSFEAFFNDRDFSSAIRTFKRLANHYADLIDEAERPY